MFVGEDKGAAHRNSIKWLKFNSLANMFLEITNDIHYGLKFRCYKKNNIEFKEEYLFEFLVIFIIGIKYCGALHLGLCVSNAFLQILCGSAA